MKISINNIGILNNVNVECQGVTLITGKNGSGKSTFGKSISSLFVGLKNAPSTYISSLVNYLKSSVAKIVGLKDYNPKEHYYFGSDHFSALKNLYSILNSIKITSDYYYYDRLILGVVNDIKENENRFFSLLNMHNLRLDEYMNIDVITGQLYSLRYEFEIMFFDKERIEMFVGQSITDELNYTFVGQVKPVNGSGETNIRYENHNVFIDYTFDNNMTLLDGDYSVIDCFYIDDASIIDKLYERRIKTKNMIASSLNDILLNKLESIINSSDKVVAREKFKSLFKLIEMVYPYEFVRDGKFVTTTNNGLNIANEASGKKIFALLKEMLYRGLINSSTILVFDEPDNHLHPKWQTIFAKLIVEISKVTGCNIFCITHSPTLLLAFDVYSRDEETDSTSGLNVYYCDPSQDNKFNDVTHNISVAHKQLADPYIDLDLFGKDNI